MERLLLSTLLLPLLAVDPAPSNLAGQAIIFPQESASAYVLLSLQKQRPLHNFTLCMKAFCDLPRAHSLFSYSTRTKDNELLLYVEATGDHTLHVGNSKVTFRVPRASNEPLHLCASWESATGIATLWVNGKPQGRKGLRQGYVLGADAKIVLGQEQDSYGGSFDAKQSFVGEVWDVHLWDKVIPVNSKGPACRSGNLLSWHALDFQASGYVVIKPQLWSGAQTLPLPEERHQPAGSLGS